MNTLSDDRPIRAALLGAGYIADWHAAAILATPGVDLVAVCDQSSAAASLQQFLLSTVYLYLLFPSSFAVSIVTNV